jgi:hypothetical protein
MTAGDVALALASLAGKYASLLFASGLAQRRNLHGCDLVAFHGLLCLRGVWIRAGRRADSVVLGKLLGGTLFVLVMNVRLRPISQPKPPTPERLSCNFSLNNLALVSPLQKAC